jgi:hypothetical protein
VRADVGIGPYDVIANQCAHWCGNPYLQEMRWKVGWTLQRHSR